VSAGWVEHGYARTTYGVQGATLRRALYHAGDGASFEEGYVALTRAADETRLYLVDGSKTADEEVAHRAHEAEVSGLATVCQALERRRAKNLAYDYDPLAAETAEKFAGWTHDALAVERHHLERIMAVAPPSLDRALESMERRRDELVATKRAWEQQTAVTQRGGAASLARRVTLRSGVAQAAREVERLDHTLARIDVRLASLRDRHHQRQVFFAQHADDARRLELVRHAQAAQHLQVSVRGKFDGMALLATSKAEAELRHHCARPEVGNDRPDRTNVLSVARQTEGASQLDLGVGPAQVTAPLPLVDRDAAVALDVTD
jgi:hypothetical protein